MHEQRLQYAREGRAQPCSIYSIVAIKFQNSKRKGQKPVNPRYIDVLCNKIRKYKQVYSKWKKPNPNTMFAKVNRIEFEGLGVNKSGQQIKPKPQSRHERQSKLNKVRSFWEIFLFHGGVYFTYYKQKQGIKDYWCTVHTAHNILKKNIGDSLLSKCWSRGREMCLQSLNKLVHKWQSQQLL